MVRLFFLLLAVSFLTACKKSEIKVPPKPILPPQPTMRVYTPTLEVNFDAVEKNGVWTKEPYIKKIVRPLSNGDTTVEYRLQSAAQYPSGPNWADFFVGYYHVHFAYDPRPPFVASNHFLQTGTYPNTTGFYSQIYIYNLGSKTYFAGNQTNSYTLEITKIEDSLYSGKFSGIVYHNGGAGPPYEELRLQNGTFSNLKIRQ